MNAKYLIPILGIALAAGCREETAPALTVIDTEFRGARLIQIPPDVSPADATFLRQALKQHVPRGEWEEIQWHTEKGSAADASSQLASEDSDKKETISVWLDLRARNKDEYWLKQQIEMDYRKGDPDDIILSGTMLDAVRRVKRREYDIDRRRHTHHRRKPSSNSSDR